MEDLIMSEEEIDAFLAEPITAQLATNGPTIRPMWYQWEEGAFWIISGEWAKLLGRVQKDPEVALNVDVGDFANGNVKQVTAYGAVEILEYDIPRGRRMLHRYLGPDEENWSSAPDDYRGYISEPGPPGIVWLKLVPRKLTGLDFGYEPKR
jgi:nitroimidazol reductase NimA-like FMN-containing flavoprotein (pyridoxamine 5'-phosphate oxidase superfamily)